MRKLLKYLGMYWRTVLAVFVVLMVQAYCDLSLPAYTSDIVNVGIQQGGIQETIPKVLSVEGMERILLFVPDPEERQKVLDAYEKETEQYEREVYALKESVEEETEGYEELCDILELPMMLVQGFASDSEETQQIREQLFHSASAEMLPEGADVFEMLRLLPREQMEGMLESIRGQMVELPEMILEQAAVSYVKTAYQELGMDMDRLQFRYLLSTGGTMIALAFLGMAASVLVGLLASRVGAAAGRDLRGKVFRK